LERRLGRKTYAAIPDSTCKSNHRFSFLSSHAVDGEARSVSTIPICSGAGNKISHPAVCVLGSGPLARVVPSLVVFFGLMLVLIGLVYQFLFFVCSGFQNFNFFFQN
jgi:hypothetical protein